MEIWHSFLAWIQESALGYALRDMGVWTYGLINLAHIVGVATLFGSILALDLRLLGWRPHVPLTLVTAITTPLAVVGFGLAVLSGICMLSFNATEYADNPFLPIKFIAIALGLVNALVLSRLSAWRVHRDVTNPSRRMQFAIFGGISLICWLAAVSAGRMIGYW